MDDVVAVWGAGPVGQFSLASAKLLGAKRVIGIDRFEYRLRTAREHLQVETINYEEAGNTVETLREMTAGRGPDVCIDGMGLEAHTPGIKYLFDRVAQAMRLETDRPIALREAIQSCRNGGVVSVPGVYGGLVDKFPIGTVMNRSLTIKTGQTHVHRYLEPLHTRIRAGEIDPSYIISHHLPLAQAADGYELFKNKEDECLKVVLQP